MKILFIGDISGPDGIRALNTNLYKLKKIVNPDLIIANAENTSNGRGLNIQDYEYLKSLGINFFTMGNHTWFHNDYKLVLSNDDIIRPLNISGNDDISNVGVGTRVIDVNGQKIRITNLLGSSIMLRNATVENPFIALEELLKEINDDCYHIVDFHSETTSEKNAFFLNFKGKVNAILGTHTHVQTADEIIVDNTAYITDVGMTGSSTGVIGADPKTIIEMFKGERKYFKLTPNIDKYQLCAVLIECEQKITKSIKRIFVRE